jgi:NAD(P)-dependent dehydrogenase (short-subunit alcohol dehydrogenase family)
MNKIVLITGASSGFGRLTAEALARAGHTVYASMRDTKGHNADNVDAIAKLARETGVDLRTVDRAVAQVIAEAGRIDVLMHNAGHMVYGPAESFTPEQYASSMTSTS